MGKAIAIALLLLFIILLSAIAYEMVRMIAFNWQKFRHLRRQDRETLEDMALWTGMTLMKIGMLIFAGDALISLFQGNPVTYRMVARGLITLPFLIAATGVLLWMVFSARYGSERGDKIWWRLIIISVAFGNIAMLAVWLWG